jgi:hypothetical protein
MTIYLSEGKYIFVRPFFKKKLVFIEGIQRVSIPRVPDDVVLGNIGFVKVVNVQISRNQLS